MGKRVAGSDQAASHYPYHVYRHRPGEANDAIVAGFDDWEEARGHATSLNCGHLARFGRPTRSPFVFFYAQRKFGGNPGWVNPGRGPLGEEPEAVKLGRVGFDRRLKGHRR